LKSDTGKEVELIQSAIEILEGHQEKFACEENHRAIRNLISAIAWLNERPKNRGRWGVEKMGAFKKQ